MTGFIALIVFIAVAGAMVYMGLRPSKKSSAPKRGGGTVDEPKGPPMAE